MVRLAQLVKDDETARKLTRMARADHTRPDMGRAAYEQRLLDIAKFCTSPKTAAQINEQFGYSPSGSYGAITRLIREGQLVREKRHYHAVRTRELADIERREVGLPTKDELYLKRLENDVRDFVWENDVVPGDLKRLVEWARARYE